MPAFYMILAEKNYQNARILIIFARKINKIPEFYFYIIFARKMPGFDIIIIARKIFSQIFFFLGGGSALPSPRLLRLWYCMQQSIKTSHAEMGQIPLL